MAPVSRIRVGAMLSRRAVKLEARVENSRPGPSWGELEEKHDEHEAKNTAYCWVDCVSVGRERARTSKRSKIFAGRDRFSPWVVSLVHRDCQLMFRSGYLNALFGETKLEFRTILLDGVSHCPRLCVAASLSLLILVCYQQWFYDSYVGNTRGIHVYSRYVLVGSMDA